MKPFLPTVWHGNCMLNSFFFSESCIWGKIVMNHAAKLFFFLREIRPRQGRNKLKIHPHSNVAMDRKDCLLPNGLKSNQIKPSALCSTAGCRVSESESAQTSSGKCFYTRKYLRLFCLAAYDGSRFYFILPHHTSALYCKTKIRLYYFKEVICDPFIFKCLPIKYNINK